MPNQNSQSNPGHDRVSQLYDDALPVNLQTQGVVTRKQGGLKLHRGEGQLSPYIIHLSRNEAQTQEDTVAHLEKLARELAIETAQLEEEVTTNDLEISSSELAQQLRETDLQITQPVRRAPNPPSTTATTPAPVSLPVLEEVAINIAELVPNTPEINAPEVTVQTEAPEPTVAEPELETLELFETPEYETKPEPEKQRKFNILQFGTARTRALAAFVALAIVFVLPLKAMQGADSVRAKQVSITESGRAALDNLLAGASALEGDRFDVAGEDFARASQNFSQAQESLDSMDSAITAIVNVLPQTDRTYQSVQGLILAGRNLSDAASQLALAGSEIADRESMDIVTKIDLLSTYVQEALPEVRTAVAALEKVDPEIVPAEYQETVTELKQTAPRLAQSMEEFVEFSDALTTIMGAEQKMRYLVVFQNNTELRATGGFTGSFAEMDVLHGEIEQIHIPAGGTYDLQGQLSDFVYPPEPMSLLNPRWEFHDANWFPDFPTSANQLLQFHSAAGGPTVDGVIAINATVMPKLLEILGPVYMEEYGREINAENFLFETQKIVEFEYEQYVDEDTQREEEAPKQFIADLAPIVLERLEDADMDTMLAVMDILGSALVEKDALLYFQSNELQSQMEQLGWSGSVKQAPDDYLMVINTNLGGGKTDTVIDQRIDVDVQVHPDGSIVNTVTITKEHLGLATGLFEGANNVDYIRLYVPRGSELLSASGFEIPDDELFEVSEVPLNVDEDIALTMAQAVKDPDSQTDIWQEEGKTVFGNWMQTKPGETEQVTFTYRLPFDLIEASEATFFDKARAKLGFKELQTYTMLIQKQPGVETRTTNIRISLPESLESIWASHAGAQQKGAEIDNATDVFMRFLLEHHRDL